MDHGCFNCNLIPITETASSETSDNIPQDYTTYHHSFWPWALSKQL